MDKSLDDLINENRGSRKGGGGKGTHGLQKPPAGDCLKEIETGVWHNPNGEARGTSLHRQSHQELIPLSSVIWQPAPTQPSAGAPSRRTVPFRSFRR